MAAEASSVRDAISNAVSDRNYEELVKIAVTQDCCGCCWMQTDDWVKLFRRALPNHNIGSFLTVCNEMRAVVEKIEDEMVDDDPPPESNLGLCALQGLDLDGDSNQRDITIRERVLEATMDGISNTSHGRIALLEEAAGGRTVLTDQDVIKLLICGSGDRLVLKTLGRMLPPGCLRDEIFQS